MAVRCRHPLQKQSPHPPPLLSTSTAASRYLHPVPDPRGSTSSHSMHYSINSRSIEQPVYQDSVCSSELSLDRQPSLAGDPERPQDRRRSAGYPASPAATGDPHRQHPNTIETRYSEVSMPARKRVKLVDTDGWMEKALDRANFMYKLTGEPDPHPFPVPTIPSGRMESPLPPSIRRNVSMQHQSHPSSRYLSPPDLSRSPGLPSATHSRRSSSVYSSSTPSRSPAPSQATIASTSRRGGLSPPDSATGLCGFSDLGLSTRANSEALDNGDLTATFDQIHNVPRPILRPREAGKPSPIERLPREIFMRIMMFCGYKDQVLLKQCSYSLYNTVDLEAVPWEKKTETILFEECYNPKNFPKKTQQASHNEERDGGGDGGDAVLDEEAGASRRSTKRKANRKADSTSPKQFQGKTKSQPENLDKWGCYCCYKVLPAYYFEGKLLEDKEGRKAKNNNSRGAAAPESDKKVDMRVEYVQILEAVPGRTLPDWLMKDKGMAVDEADMEAYVRERMERGVNCDDLRAYYENITRDTHLVAPLRAINPVFVPSAEIIPPIEFDRSATQISHVPKSSSTITPQAKSEPVPTIRSRSSPKDFETCRSLYKLPATKSPRGDLESASYTYKITIPRDAERDKRPLQLPTSQPVGRMCLPDPHTMNHDIQKPTLQAGDVVSLRRVCIPCGTKFAVYRRDCNRKTISKTDEAWWVCDCPQVRLAGRSTGCPTCGRRVIY